MNYLSENNLLEYAVLEEKATAATAHHNDLSAQIKAAEKRMAEIAVLRTHIGTNEILCSKELGGLPTTSKPHQKRHSCSGAVEPVCINTGIAFNKFPHINPCWSKFPFYDIL